MLCIYPKMFQPQINLYATKYSNPCQAVLMTAKELKIRVNLTEIDLTKGQHLSEEYLKINPAHTLPAINDNGFVLFESRAIMKYLCDRFSVDCPLYPKNPKERALIDQILDFDIVFFSTLKDAIAKPLFGFPKNEEKVNLLMESLGILDRIIGDKKYLVGDGLTIADISVLATTQSIIAFGVDVTDCPNFKRWITEMMGELSYYKEICAIDMEEMMAFVKRMQAFHAKRTAMQNG